MNEIKVEDFFRKKGENGIYKAMYVEDDYVSGDTMVSTAKAFPQADVELVDPKTAFLCELKELLAKYDAAICDYESYRVIFYLNYDKDNEEKIGFDTTDCVINAYNVMDFDKE